MSKKILIIEDDDDSRALLGEVLSLGGHEFVEAASVEEAQEALSQGSFDLILSDLWVPGAADAGAIVDVIRQAGHTAPILLISGDVSLKEIAAHHQVGYLAKPISMDDLLRVTR